MKLYLEIHPFTGDKIEVELKQTAEDGYISWGITAIGCVLTCADGSCFMIHPKSVSRMRQYWR